MDIKIFRSAIASIAASAVIALSGCSGDIGAITAGANTAGNLALSTWFAIEEPDAAVKTVLKDVVMAVTKATVDISAGETFLDAALPGLQKIVATHSNLTPAQRNLVNTGIVVILNGLDAFIASNEKVKDSIPLASSVVAAFGRGCETAISVLGTADACRLAKARALISAK